MRETFFLKSDWESLLEREEEFEEEEGEEIERDLAEEGIKE